MVYINKKKYIYIYISIYTQQYTYKGHWRSRYICITAYYAFCIVSLYFGMLLLTMSIQT